MKTVQLAALAVVLGLSACAASRDPYAYDAQYQQQSQVPTATSVNYGVPDAFGAEPKYDWLFHQAY